MLNIIDNNLKDCFQKNIVLTLKNKQYKKGKLINFKLSGCFISIVMLTEKKKETFEIPFPFSVKTENNKLVFDYTLESLAEQDFDLLVNLKATNQVKKCKFYNTILTISSLN
jgi:hypothetical protein